MTCSTCPAATAERRIFDFFIDSATLEVDAKDEYVFDSLSNTSVCIDGIVRLDKRKMCRLRIRLYFVRKLF